MFVISKCSFLCFFFYFSNPYLPNLRSQQSFIFFIGNILGLDYKIRLMIHFAIILMICLIKCLRSIIFHMDIQLFQHNQLEKLLFPHELTWHICLKSIDHICVHLFLYPLFCFINAFLSLCQFHVVYIVLVLKACPEIKKYVIQFSFKIILFQLLCISM